MMTIKENEMVSKILLNVLIGFGAVIYTAVLFALSWMTLIALKHLGVL